MAGKWSYQLRWRGQFAKEAARKGAVEGLRNAAEFIGQESSRQVPLEEGTLDRSRSITVDERNLTATISYDTPYAVRQHEGLSYRHNGGRKAKYLEDPLLQNRDKVQKYLAQFIKRSL